MIMPSDLVIDDYRRTHNLYGIVPFLVQPNETLPSALVDEREDMQNYGDNRFYIRLQHKLLYANIANTENNYFPEHSFKKLRMPSKLYVFIIKFFINSIKMIYWIGYIPMIRTYHYLVLRGSYHLSAIRKPKTMSKFSNIFL